MRTETCGVRDSDADLHLERSFQARMCLDFSLHDPGDCGGQEEDPGWDEPRRVARTHTGSRDHLNRRKDGAPICFVRAEV